ncbi:hypothetical protein MPER_04759, partial [Moniliophthora perniciosa FA553]
MRETYTQAVGASGKPLVETLSILSILITRFPLRLSTTELNPPPLTVLAPLLSHPRPVVRKRAIVTISQFIPITAPELFADLLQKYVFPNLAPNANVEKQRTTVQLVAAVAKNSPAHISPSLNDIVPHILKAAQRDDDELREGCLQALEVLLLRCPSEITSYLPNIIQVGNRFIKYDPLRNYAEGDEMADADDEYENDAQLH